MGSVINLKPLGNHEWCVTARQVPHDQPLVAQAMIERWVDDVLDKRKGSLQLDAAFA